MHSFIFPEDLNSTSPQSLQRQCATSTQKSLAKATALPPQISRGSPVASQREPSPPPAPTHAPPPIPSAKKKAVVSVTELSVPEDKQKPEAKKKKNRWYLRQSNSPSNLNDKNEAKALGRDEEATAAVDIVLPPLSPIVDDEFWLTGRYPSSQQELGLMHVTF